MQVPRKAKSYDNTLAFRVSDGHSELIPVVISWALTLFESVILVLIYPSAQ